MLTEGNALKRVMLCDVLPQDAAFSLEAIQEGQGALSHRPAHGAKSRTAQGGRKGMP